MDLDRARARRWWCGRPKITRIDRAAAFVEDLGFCLLLPNQGVTLPSLYEAASDRPLFSPAGDRGPDADRVWAWKDELPRRGLAWYGKFLRGRPSLLSPSLLGDLYPRRGRPDDCEEQELSPRAHRIARLLLRSGPQSTVALREALDVEGRGASEDFRRALAELGRALVVTNFGAADEGGAWPVPVLELTARAFRVPPLGRRSRLRAAERYLDTMVAATPAELASAFRLELEESRDLLETLVRRGRAARDEAGRYVVRAGQTTGTRART
ncbi:MAG: hypothetical protein KatS3mg014_0754 [Actinomycetota bacterium]|nr:MAG: hypothetical protein KatS3mg014_0754 [Actinomycetota bacterium]